MEALLSTRDSVPHIYSYNKWRASLWLPSASTRPEEACVVTPFGNGYGFLPITSVSFPVLLIQAGLGAVGLDSVYQGDDVFIGCLIALGLRGRAGNILAAVFISEVILVKDKIP